MAAHFDRLTKHLVHVANIKWLHSVADDFFTKQLPFNVTWVLTLMYAMDQGQVANDPRAQVSMPPLCFYPPNPLRPPSPWGPCAPPTFSCLEQCLWHQLCVVTITQVASTMIVIIHCDGVVVAKGYEHIQKTCDEFKAVNISVLNCFAQSVLSSAGMLPLLADASGALVLKMSRAVLLHVCFHWDLSKR